jgi:hypothetical protein
MTPSIQLAGIVKDFDTQEPVEKASIKIGEDSGSSNEQGEYELFHPPGDWIIQVTASGYQSLYDKLSIAEGEHSVEKDFIISKSGLLTVITGTITDQVSWKPVDWVEIRTDGGGYTFSDMEGNYNLYQKPGTWTMMAVADGYRFYATDVTVDQGGQNKIIDIELSPIVTSTTTTKDPTGTTTVPGLCPTEELYGENSEQTELLREFRDNVLRKSPEGRELIRLYYEWSPGIAKAMERDGEFREEVKEMIDGILPLIEETE